MEKVREFQKNIYFCFIDYAKVFDSVDHSKLWKILKEMGILGHLTCLLRNLYAVKKQQLESDIEQQIYLAPCLKISIISICVWSVYGLSILFH